MGIFANGYIATSVIDSPSRIARKTGSHKCCKSRNIKVENSRSTVFLLTFLLKNYTEISISSQTTRREYV